eukprot:6163056-Lingulodinium_polyedra.AAC.1
MERPKCAGRASSPKRQRRRGGGGCFPVRARGQHAPDVLGGECWEGARWARRIAVVTWGCQRGERER